MTIQNYKIKMAVAQGRQHPLSQLISHSAKGFTFVQHNVRLVLASSPDTQYLKCLWQSIVLTGFRVLICRQRCLTADYSTVRL